jgi:hypothetical protein
MESSNNGERDREREREGGREGKIYRPEFVFLFRVNIFLQKYSCVEVSCKIADCYKLFV